MSLDLDDHVGRTLLALDLNGGCSPTIQAILPGSADLEEEVRNFNAAFQEFMDEQFLPGKWEWVLDNGKPKFSLHGRSKVIKPRAERSAEFDAMLAKLHGLQDSAPPKPVTHEKDGTLGWWRVDGVRHGAIVKASSAAEAIDKAVTSDAVGSWESPDAEWIGEELPEVFGC
jgi:hypothetical protein